MRQIVTLTLAALVGVISVEPVSACNRAVVGDMVRMAEDAVQHGDVQMTSVYNDFQQMADDYIEKRNPQFAADQKAAIAPYVVGTLIYEHMTSEAPDGKGAEVTLQNILGHHAESEANGSFSQNPPHGCTNESVIDGSILTNKEWWRETYHHGHHTMETMGGEDLYLPNHVHIHYVHGINDFRDGKTLDQEYDDYQAPIGGVQSLIQGG